MRFIDKAGKVPLVLRRPARYIYNLFPPSIRLGKDFWETYEFLQESQWWSEEKLEEYQLAQLSRLLRHAYDNVPYYRRIFDERDLKPKDIQSLENLKKLPYLTKDQFKEHFNELVATNIDIDKLHVGHTTGTTGKALQFYMDNTIKQKELAFIFHQWSRVGYKPAEKRVDIRGAINQGRPDEISVTSNLLRLSPRIGNLETAKYYLEKIRRFNASFIHGYPSAIAQLAGFIKQYDLSVPFRLKAVLFASEAIYDWEREVVRGVFDCRTFSHYGMAEKVALAAECEFSSNYHFLPQYGITEIDPETNEIVGTGFLNHINPFIRYKTTDVAIGAASHCDTCKRGCYPVIKQVEGRMGDYIVTSGGLIGPAAITHSFRNLKTIKDTQIVQKDINHTLLRIVPWDKKDTLEYDNEVEQLRHNLMSIIGDDTRIAIEETSEVERTRSGKFKWIISDISNDMLQRGRRD